MLPIETLKYVTENSSYGSLSSRLILKHFGEECAEWECETLWIELTRLGLVLDDIDKVKISAYMSLKVNPMAIWELNTFQNTILASNNHYPIPEQTQEATPHEIGWGMVEIEKFLRDVNPDVAKKTIIWGDDLKHYIAACLNREGWFIAPAPMTIAQDLLDYMNKNVEEIKPKILYQWSQIDKTALETAEFKQDDEVELQLHRLQSYVELLRFKNSEYKQHLSSLGF